LKNVLYPYINTSAGLYILSLVKDCTGDHKIFMIKSIENNPNVWNYCYSY